MSSGEMNEYLEICSLYEGRVERLNQIHIYQHDRMIKLNRKKRRKRDKMVINDSQMTCQIDHFRWPKLYRSILLIGLIIILIVDNVTSQLILDHPRHKAFKPPSSIKDRRHSNSTSNQHQNELSSDLKNGSEKSLNSLNGHEELLRRLSSTMLIENMLRFPHPINKSRLSLLLPSFHSHPPYREDRAPSDEKSFGNTSNTAKQSHDHKTTPSTTFVMGTSSSNPTNTISSDTSDQIMAYDKPSTATDSFNPRSLTYLVEKLLNMDPSKQNLSPPKARPSQRPATPRHHNNEVTSQQDITVPNVTLDKLIKDEYDSRVQPMIKLLKAQQTLSASSSPRTTTPYTPGPHQGNNFMRNHRIEEIARSEATTSVTMNEMPNRHDETTVSPAPSVVIFPKNVIESIISSGSTRRPISNMSDRSDEDEELNEQDNLDDDYEDGPEEGKFEKQSTKSVRPIKLNNVPPYQLGTEFSHHTRTDQSLNEMVESSSNRRNGSIQKSGSERAVDASTRGSLVFSDGDEEAADRANKRKVSNGLANDSHDKIPKSPTKSDKLGESFLLNHLLSTVNPMIDLNIKMNEQPTHKSYDSLNQFNNNPLIYKGYVGKDDYLLSTTASDWSRPIGNTRDTLSTNIRKFISQPTTTSTTPAPPTEPPTVPYNYFLHQPVTNAQSVPSMVIPTSDPPDLTTIMPSSYETNDPIRNLTPQTPNYGAVATRPPNFSPPFADHTYDHSNRFDQSSSSASVPSNTKSYAPKIMVHDRKYSYQIPDKSSKSQVQNQTLAKNFPHLSTMTVPNQITSKASNNFQQQHQQQTHGESDNDTKLKVFEASSRFNNTTPAAAWLPTTVTQNEINNSLDESLRKSNHPDVLLISNKDTSSLMSFPVVEAKTRQQQHQQQFHRQGGKNHTSLTHNGKNNNPHQQHGSDRQKKKPTDEIPPKSTAIITTTAATTTTATSSIDSSRPDRNESNSELPVGANDVAHQGPVRFTPLRNKSGVSTKKIMVDDSGEPDDSSKSNHRFFHGNNNNNKTTRWSQGDDDLSQLTPPDDGDSSEGTDQDESPNSQLDNNDNYENGNIESDVQPNERQRFRNLPKSGHSNQRNASNVMPSGTTTRKNVNKFINHEPAGSEIRTSGLADQRVGPSNQNFTRHQRPSISTQPKSTSSVLIGGTDGSFTIPASVLNGQSIVDPLYGSTNLPSSTNFFGEASSERPMMDNSIQLLGGTSIRSNPPIDPYQHIGSNNVISSIQQPSSTTLMPTTSSPKLQTGASSPSSTTTTSTTTTTSATNTNKDITDDIGQGKSSPTTKTNSDRLAFILIGGSCVLSVVCLVLAAMSMRCSDMCDDYQSLRNAERAALKLQRHRLKYTKNHQINRLNRAGGHGSAGSGQSLIDEMNLDGNGGASSLDSELNQARNNRLTQNQNVKFQEFCKNNNNDDRQQLWNSTNYRLPVSALIDINNNGKETCGCGDNHQHNSHRYICQDEPLHLGKQQSSKMLPYYYMQHSQQHPRLRPLFGAGSSIGTFLPRRHDDLHHQSFRTGGGSMDAQVLIDNQQPLIQHTCGASNPQQARVTRSKSILIENKSTKCNCSPNECSNSDHNHHAHICHNHHHHTRCQHNNNNNNNNTETSTSEESEMTFDESANHHHLCNDAHCGGHHEALGGGRLKLAQLARLNNQLSSGWKKQQQHQVAHQARKASHSGHHHNHHSHPHPHQHHHHHHLLHNQATATTTSSDLSSPGQCTCSRDHQPILDSINKLHHHNNGHNHHQGNLHKTSHKHHSASKHDLKMSLKQQAKRDKSMLIWSTNRDRLI